ncbi:MAG TPA: ATP-binding protein [Candidatus Sulfotelmatobacter sp.]|nr:ATP-binding protein [Candidatus Sulfotelmatobacter sp.]
MELILFIGLQATGKSSFYRHTFFRTHVRVNLDMLRTRHREKLLVDACIASKTKFIVDNTNLTRDDRARYISPAKAAGFRVIGYFFESQPADALRRNAARPKGERVPDIAIRSASNKLQIPSLSEGFDELYSVRLVGENQFSISNCKL